MLVDWILPFKGKRSIAKNVNRLKAEKGSSLKVWKFIMEFHKKEAIFLQIVEMICEKILTRQWREGDKIPSIRELSVVVEVNPNTVMRSYAYLQERSIIINKRGIGYFVAEHAYDDTLELMKTKFIRDDLPLFFKTIRLLNIGFDELSERFIKFEKEKNEDKNKQ